MMAWILHTILWIPLGIHPSTAFPSRHKFLPLRLSTRHPIYPPTDYEYHFEQYFFLQNKHLQTKMIKGYSHFLPAPPTCMPIHTGSIGFHLRIHRNS